MIRNYLSSQYNHQILVIFKDHNLDLTEAGIEPRAARGQSSARPSELYDLITSEASGG